MVVEHNIKSLLNIAHRVYLLDKRQGCLQWKDARHNSKKAIQKFFLNANKSF